MHIGKTISLATCRIKGLEGLGVHCSNARCEGIKEMQDSFRRAVLELKSAGLIRLMGSDRAS